MTEQLDPRFHELTERQLEGYREAFARMWPERNEEPVRLPGGDYTNIRRSIRDNIRGQRATKARQAGA